MLSVHGDFQLTQDSLSLWLTDLDVLLTNLEHLSEAPNNEKIRQLDVRFNCEYSLVERIFFRIWIVKFKKNNRKLNMFKHVRIIY
jgi:hypothetical protein